MRRAIDAGELPAVKLRSRLRITPDDFASWIASSRTATARATAVPPPRKRRPHSAGTFRALLPTETDGQAQL